MYCKKSGIKTIHLNGQALIKKFYGEFLDKYFNEIMEYIEMKSDRFMDLCDKFRSEHLWAKINGEWKLRHSVNEQGTDN